MEQQTLGTIWPYLITQGPWAVISLGLAISAWRLFNLLIKVQEARIEDAQKAAASIVEMARQLDAQRELLKDLIAERQGNRP